LSAANSGKVIPIKSGVLPLCCIASLTPEKFTEWCKSSLALENLKFTTGKDFVESHEYRFDVDSNPWNLQLLSEDAKNVYFLIEEHDSDEIDSDITNELSLFEERLKSTIEHICTSFDYDYTRYFLNRIFTTNKETFGPADPKTKALREKMANLAKDTFLGNLIGEEGPTSGMASDNYEERFQMRPFYGEGIKKLPTVDLKNLNCNYDCIFINEKLSMKEDNEQVKKNLGDSSKIEKVLEAL
jgi:hypothetical protein